MTLNNVAYELADKNLELEKAQQWGEKALHDLEAQSLKTDSEDAALNNTRDLGYIWDTMGWIYFRQGEMEKAERYLRAAFALTQESVVGDHVGQLLEKQGKKEQAARYYLLALACTDRRNRSDIRKHYVALTGKEPDLPLYPQPPRLTHEPAQGKNGPATTTLSPGEELSRARLYKINLSTPAKGNATFSMVFSPGKIEDAKFVSGDDQLRTAQGALAASPMRAELPNKDAVRLTRRGLLVCNGPTCDFTLLLPNSAHATE